MSKKEESNVATKEKPSELRNDHVKVKLKKSDGCKIHLDIDISPLAAQAAQKKALKLINKEVSIPGFRKGKAPDNLILKNYQKHVDREWKDIAMQTAFQEALTLTKLYPYSQDTIKNPQMKSLSLEDGGSMSISFESFPEIPEIDPKKLKLKKVKKNKASDEDFDKALIDIQYQYAEWDEVTERALEDGDYATLTILNIDEEPPTPLAESTRFHIAEDKMGKWMKKLIIGLKTGEQAEGVSKNEKKQKDFKKTNCRITVEKIETATLPERDDELAKKTGSETYAELEKNVKAELDRMNDEQWKEEMRKQVQEAVNKKYPFDLPSILIDDEVKARKKAITAYNKKTLPKEEATEEKLEELANKAAEEVVHAYRMHFIMQEIIKAQNFNVSDTEVTLETMKQLYLKSPQERIIDHQMSPEDAKSRILTHLLMQKVQDFLIEGALETEKEKA